MAKAKTIPTGNDVLEYIDTLPNDRKKQEALWVLDYFKKTTKLKPRMWGPSIIGFGRYHYKYESGHEGDAALLSFSPRKTNLVFYLINSTEEQKELLKKLGKYRTGKVCLYINKLADVDQNVLEKIISSAWKYAKNKYA